MESRINKSYFENLDALRFFAFLSVFLAHCSSFFAYKFDNKYLELLHKHVFRNGNLGVGFFFVLSGFLITWLLFTEKDQNGRIHIGHFYMRRVLRIWPVYFIVVTVGFVIGTHDFELLNALQFNYSINIEQLKFYIFFLANYDLVLNGISSLLLSVLWSVAVEEQFYIVWPLIFLLAKKEFFPFICYLLIIISFVSRYTLQTYYSTPEVMSDLAIGGLIAYYALYCPVFLDFFKTISKSKTAFVYLLFFMIAPLRGFSFVFGEKIYAIYYCFESILFSCIFGFIILEQNFSNQSFFKLGRIKVFGYLGKISFGLYAYHMLFFPVTFYFIGKSGMAENDFKSYLFKIIFSLLLTVAFSYLSFNFLEKKILYFKKYFKS
ncbi:MAG: acyltransferase [Bacteroidota bacterium]